MESKKQCICCGYHSIEGISDICPVCFWQKDIFQEKYIDDDGGPNLISLRISQENFNKFGVIDQKFKSLVRPPKEDEL
ncbi:CPCC family cysteine-rich protein [Dyadobacter tibetensis]|uniref:CPCC family cysteine-rich protein n=1 Tax=Dyadobacter tibetensis TaxID=1211851 RepID=UPI000A0366AA|nr:CPCC family cysteine-rich protein [Dyadobacter tibetensis]